MGTITEILPHLKKNPRASAERLKGVMMNNTTNVLSTMSADRVDQKAIAVRFLPKAHHLSLLGALVVSGKRLCLPETAH